MYATPKLVVSEALNVCAGPWKRVFSSPWNLVFSGCLVISTLPNEHRKVTNKSFGPRYAEGIYLHSDSATPSVWMFDMISKTAMMVSDFKAYPHQFPMRDPTCLVSASFTHKEAILLKSSRVSSWKKIRNDTFWKRYFQTVRVTFSHCP